MKKKTAKHFEYDGLGFPIILLNVKLISVRGVEVPDIDYNTLQRDVLLALCNKPLPLTGNEIRFIRQYLEMTYTEFAKHFGITHPTVIHWEKSKNMFAKITPSTELCIRLYILDVLKANSKVFRSTFREFNYSEFLKESKTRQELQKSDYITLDIKNAV